MNSAPCLKPPMAPTCNRALGYCQCLHHLNRRRTQRGASHGHQHHDQSKVEASPQKPYRHRSRSFAAPAAAKAKPDLKVWAYFWRAATWFAWVVGCVQDSAA